MSLLSRLFGAGSPPAPPEPPDDPWWSQWEHAYGPAGNVPGLLEAMSAEASDSVWFELWSCLCHQGDVYTASYAALPPIVRFAATLPPRARGAALDLASAIVARSDWEAIPPELRDDYLKAKEEGSRLARESLRAAEGSGAVFSAFLQAVAAFEDVPCLRNDLDVILSEEMELECPHCDEFLWVKALSGLLLSENEERSQPIARPDSLPEELKPINSLCQEGGFKDHQEAISMLCGTSCCPCCGTEIIPYRVAVEEEARENRRRGIHGA